MKSLALVFTVLALASPLAAHASDSTCSKQYVGAAKSAAIMSDILSNNCGCNDPDTEPYVIRG